MKVICVIMCVLCECDHACHSVFCVNSVCEYVTVCETGYECDVYDCVLCDHVCDCTCNCILC